MNFVTTPITDCTTSNSGLNSAQMLSAHFEAILTHSSRLEVKGYGRLIITEITGLHRRAVKNFRLSLQSRNLHTAAMASEELNKVAECLRTLGHSLIDTCVLSADEALLIKNEAERLRRYLLKLGAETKISGHTIRSAVAGINTLVNAANALVKSPRLADQSSIPYASTKATDQVDIFAVEATWLYHNEDEEVQRQIQYSGWTCLTSSGSILEDCDDC
jgi:hypothetical protein